MTFSKTIPHSKTKTNKRQNSMKILAYLLSSLLNAKTRGSKTSIAVCILLPLITFVYIFKKVQKTNKLSFFELKYFTLIQKLSFSLVDLYCTLISFYIAKTQ